MPKELWINLPVKDINQSKDFFEHLGFSVNIRGEAARVAMGEPPVSVMLFPEDVIKSFTKSELPDTNQTSQVLFSIGVQSREELDELVDKVREAGGTIYDEPRENQGWMYGAAFSDLDGHKWNFLYMDESKMPK